MSSSRKPKSKSNDILFRSERKTRNLDGDPDKYATPDHIYNELNKEFRFIRNSDPCPIDWNPKTHPDGLKMRWRKRVFVNPPYSDVPAWIRKSVEECKKGSLVVMLINACTDTRVFHDCIYKRHEIRFIRGRLKFKHAKYGILTSNVRPSMIVIFRPEDYAKGAKGYH